MAIPSTKNPFKDLMPEEAEYYLERHIQAIKYHPMWKQAPEDPLQLTPVQQLQWFELLAREEATRLLQDGQGFYGPPDGIELPLRNVPRGWNQVLARLPQRLANFTKYSVADLNKTVHPSKPGIPEDCFWVHQDIFGDDAVEAIIRLFLKEADAELFPIPKKPAPADGKSALSDADQKLYKDLGHENIATTTNKELWETKRFQLGLQRDGFGAFRAKLSRIRKTMNLPSSKSISSAKKKSVQP